MRIFWISSVYGSELPSSQFILQSCILIWTSILIPEFINKTPQARPKMLPVQNVNQNTLNPRWVRKHKTPKHFWVIRALSIRAYFPISLENLLPLEKRKATLILSHRARVPTATVFSKMFSPPYPGRLHRIPKSESLTGGLNESRWLSSALGAHSPDFCCPIASQAKSGPVKFCGFISSMLWRKRSHLHMYCCLWNTAQT